MMPAKPIIEPIERSNSPAIISSATAAARMPSWAETSRKFTMPLALNRPLSPAVMPKKHEDQNRSGNGPKFGPAEQPAKQRHSADPFVLHLKAHPILQAIIAMAARPIGQPPCKD